MLPPDQIRDMVLLSDSNPFDQPFTDEKFDRVSYQKLLMLYKERTGEELTDKALISMLESGEFNHYGSGENSQ